MDEIRLGHLITGAIAGAIALVFNKYPRTRSEKVKAYSLVCGGAIVTAYLTPALLLWQEWLIGAEYGVAFIIGLFGMGLLEGIYKIIQSFITNPLGIIEQIVNIFRGKR